MEKDSWEFHINFTTLDLYTDMKRLIISCDVSFLIHIDVCPNWFCPKTFQIFLYSAHSQFISSVISPTHLSTLSKNIVSFTHFSSVTQVYSRIYWVRLSNFYENTVVILTHSHLLVRSHILICHFFANKTQITEKITEKHWKKLKTVSVLPISLFRRVITKTKEFKI